MREAIYSAATRRVGACLNRVRNCLRILRNQRVMPEPAHSAPPGGSVQVGSSKFPSELLKSIKGLLSFWSRFWCLLGPFWLPFWHTCLLFFGPSSLLDTYLVRKRPFHGMPLNVTKNTLFPSPDRPQGDPKSAQIASERRLCRS